MREHNHETSELVLLLLLAVTTLSCVDAASNDTEYVYRMHVALPRSEKDLLPQIWAVHCVGLAISPYQTVYAYHVGQHGAKRLVC